MACDVRISRPTTLIRSGLYVFTYVDYTGATTTATTELRAYNSAGAWIPYPFSNAPVSTQTLTYSGIVVYPNGLTPRQVGSIWLFKDAATSAAAVSFHILLWCSGSTIDYW